MTGRSTSNVKLQPVVASMGNKGETDGLDVC
jgi:hypothetical protein